MMFIEQPWIIDYSNWPELLPNIPMLNSFQSSWSSIQLAHYHQLSVDLSEISSCQPIIIIPLEYQTINLELISEGHFQIVSYQEKDYTHGFVEIFPAYLPYGLRSNPTAKGMEWIQCCLEPTFVAQIAHESVNSDRVELLPIPKKSDLLIHQIGLALMASLDVDGSGRRFYADSMATALPSHLLRHYSTQNPSFRDYEDGLPKQKLKQAIEYIQAHLGEKLSLNDIANELGMSQYYFCHLFKRSVGMSPHQFLIQQRVERAKQLLRESEQSVTAIALECGFANQSHFAKCFRRYTGMNPNQFRKS